MLQRTAAAAARRSAAAARAAAPARRYGDASITGVHGVRNNAAHALVELEHRAVIAVR
jgi:hypothetical protein